MFTKPPSHHHRQRGFTLPEMMIATTISVLLLAGICSFTMFNGRSLVTLFNYVDLDQANQRTLDRMTKDFRGVLSLASISATSLTLTDNDGKAITYTYDSANKSLTRTKNGVSVKLLKDLETLSFAMEQRNLVGGSFTAVSTTNVADCKIINVNWTSSRTVLGTKSAMQSPQVARIVIRN